MKEPSAISLLTNAELLTIYERSSLIMAGGTQEQISLQTKAHAELRKYLLARMDRGVGPIHVTNDLPPFREQQVHLTDPHTGEIHTTVGPKAAPFRSI